METVGDTVFYLTGSEIKLRPTVPITRCLTTEQTRSNNSFSYVKIFKVVSSTRIEGSLMCDEISYFLLINYLCLADAEEKTNCSIFWLQECNSWLQRAHQLVSCRLQPNYQNNFCDCNSVATQHFIAFSFFVNYYQAY